MIIQPNNDAQAVITRCRPHDPVAGYLFLCWFESEKVYPFITDLDYEDGHISGMIEVPVVGLKNGQRLTTIIYPVVDSEAVTEAIEALRASAPYYATSEDITAFIQAQTALFNIIAEIYRGIIFVQTQTEQPYTIT
jgi:hypothetical protein